MTQPHYCPRCHNPLATDAPAGLCPNCLFGLALESSTAVLDPLEHSDTISPDYHLTGAMLLGNKQTFGDYELLEEIARGGMGVVYKARQLSLNRIVALKMMLPSLLASAAEVQRFRAEAEAAANLQHPNIVAIHEVGEHDGQLYFSMDYVEGKSLAVVIREHPLPAETAAGYVKTIAEAIDYAHRQGFLHRDLKPSNVLLDSTNQVRITDFGLAKRLDSDSRLTITGAALGTPSYMPPEQAAGKNDLIGKASDVYSIGAILYELLTGRPPFQAATPLDTVLLVLNSEPVTPRLLVPKLDRDLETICLKCLEKEPRKRYQSAQALAEDLGRYLNRKPIVARPINRVNRAWRWCRRNPWPTLASAALVLLTVLASVSAFTYRERLWQSLLDQVRLERLAGNRAKSLKAVAQAARIKQTTILYQEATQTITSPGVTLLHQFPYADHSKPVFSPDSKPVFSPDSKMLAFHSSYGEGGKDLISILDKQPIVVWDVGSGKLIASTECETFAFSPPFRPPLQNPSPSKVAQSEPPKIGPPLKGAPGKSPPDETLLAISKVIHETVTREVEGGGTLKESTGIKEQTVRLWNPLTGKDVAETNSVAQFGCEEIDGPLIFSPDGAYLVKGDNNGRIWVIQRDNLDNKVLCIEGKPITFISYNELLINIDGRIQRWNITTQKPRFATLPGMTALSVSANGHIALLRSNEAAQYNSLSVWDILSNRQIGSLSVPEENELSVVLSADGRLAAVYNLSTPTLIHLWDLTTSTFRHRTMMLGSNIMIYFDQTAFSPDGSMIAVFGTEGLMVGVWVLDTETGREVAILRDNYSPVWSGNSRLLATAGPGRIIRDGGKNTVTSRTAVKGGFHVDDTLLNVWEVTPPTPTYLIPANIYSLSFNSNSNQLAANGTLWNVLKLDKFEIPKLSPSNQKLPGNYIFFDGFRRMWATDFERHEFPIKFWQLSPEKSESILESPDYSSIKLRLNGGGSNTIGKPSLFAISPDGKFLVMICNLGREMGRGGFGGGGDATLELWDLVAQKRLAIWNQENLHMGFSCVSFSPDGKRVATCSSPGVVIWDAATGKILQKLGKDSTARMIVFSPDSKLIFSGTNFFSNNSWGIVVNEVESGREIGTWRGHQGPITALAINREGYYLASGGEDRNICLWAVPSRSELTRWQDPAGHLLNKWEAHNTAVTALAFDMVWGSTLVTGGVDGTLKLWNVLSINKELETLGLNSRVHFSRITIITLTMFGGGYLIFLAGWVVEPFLRKKLGLKPHYPPRMLSMKIGGSIMITGILLMYFWPGAFPLWNYSTQDYIQRLLYLVIPLPAVYLLFAKWLPRLSFIMKKKQLVQYRER